MYEPPAQVSFFRMRASYRSETFKVVDQLVSNGIKKIAVVYHRRFIRQGNGLTGVQQAMKEKNIAPVAVAKPPPGNHKSRGGGPRQSQRPNRRR